MTASTLSWRVICATACFLIASAAYGEDRQLEIHDKTWFDYHQKRIERLHLADLSKSTHPLHFRISDGSFAVEIWTTDGQSFHGILVDFTWRQETLDDLQHAPRQFYSTTTLLSPQAARQVHDQFERFAIFSMPPQEKIAGWGNGFDGVIYAVEVATPGSYSFKTYWTPTAFKDKVSEAAALVGLLEQLDAQLKLETSHARFTDALPPVGCYSTDGLLMSCFESYDAAAWSEPFRLDDYLHSLWDPAVSPHAGWSRDSAGNSRLQAAVGGSLPVTSRLRMRFSAVETRVSNGDRAARHTDVWAGFTAYPKGGISIKAAGGAGRGDRFHPLGRFQLSVPISAGSVVFSLKAHRTLLDATPELAASGVVHDELQIEPIIRVASRVSVYGSGGLNWIHGGLEENRSHSVGGGLFVALARRLDVSAEFAESAYRRPGQTAFFAPARTQTIMAGAATKLDWKILRTFLTYSAGAERIRTDSAAPAVWRGVYRGHALVSFRPSRREGGWDFGFKLDAQTTLSGGVLATGPNWRFISSDVFLRYSKG